MSDKPRTTAVLQMKIEPFRNDKSEGYVKVIAFCKATREFFMPRKEYRGGLDELIPCEHCGGEWHMLEQRPVNTVRVSIR